MIGRTASARNLEVEGVRVSLPTTGLLEDYEQLIGPARRRFVGSSAVLALQSRADAQFLHAFLLHFCSLGARMTEPVEDWIRQASAKCAALFDGKDGVYIGIQVAPSANLLDAMGEHARQGALLPRPTVDRRHARVDRLNFNLVRSATPSNIYGQPPGLHQSAICQPRVWCFAYTACCGAREVASRRSC